MTPATSEPEKPDYINKEIKKVSIERLQNVLRELNRRHEEERRQAQRYLAEALNTGFRCCC